MPALKGPLLPYLNGDVSPHTMFFRTLSKKKKSGTEVMLLQWAWIIHLFQKQRRKFCRAIYELNTSCVSSCNYEWQKLFK